MEKQVNPNDFKVVKFTNKTDFGFTPEMGCMYDSRPISGITGAPGINAGESMVLPYHVAHLIARNLAKIAITKSAPNTDPAGIPTGVPLWDEARLTALKSSYLEELYTEQKPLAMTETEKLMAKVEEYRKLTEDLLRQNSGTPIEPVVTPVITPEVSTTASEPTLESANTVENTVVEVPQVYQDKQEVLAELDKRGIKHDKRQTKETLEKLLA